MFVKSTKLRLAAAAFVLVVVAALTAASVGASPERSSKSLTGGTYRVGWESSFGWTSGFDPTGEYLANAFAIYSSLLVRTLVGYNHVAGAAGNKLVPDIATTVAEADERRYALHVQAQERHPVRAAREP